MRDPARHFSPGLHALHAQEVGHLLEEEDQPARACGVAHEARAGEEDRELASVARELQLALDGLAPPARVERA